MQVSACKSSGPLGWNLSWFLLRDWRVLILLLLEGFPRASNLQGPIYTTGHWVTLREKSVIPKVTMHPGHRVSNPDHLIQSAVHWLLHHCASTNQVCNERKLRTCVYSLVHNWANTSSLTKAMVLSFCQTSTGKCMHHPTEKKLLSWVRHSTIA